MTVDLLPGKKTLMFERLTNTNILHELRKKDNGRGKNEGKGNREKKENNPNEKYEK